MPGEVHGPNYDPGNPSTWTIVDRPQIGEPGYVALGPQSPDEGTGIGTDSSYNKIIGTGVQSDPFRVASPPASSISVSGTSPSSKVLQALQQFKDPSGNYNLSAAFAAGKGTDVYAAKREGFFTDEQVLNSQISSANAGGQAAAQALIKSQVPSFDANKPQDLSLLLKSGIAQSDLRNAGYPADAVAAAAANIGQGPSGQSLDTINLAPSSGGLTVKPNVLFGGLNLVSTTGPKMVSDTRTPSQPSAIALSFTTPASIPGSAGLIMPSWMPPALPDNPGSKGQPAWTSFVRTQGTLQGLIAAGQYGIPLKDLQSWTGTVFTGGYVTPIGPSIMPSPEQSYRSTYGPSAFAQAYAKALPGGALTEHFEGRPVTAMGVAQNVVGATSILFPLYKGGVNYLGTEYRNIGQSAAQGINEAGLGRVPFSTPGYAIAPQVTVPNTMTIVNPSKGLATSYDLSNLDYTKTAPTSGGISYPSGTVQTTSIGLPRQVVQPSINTPGIPQFIQTSRGPFRTNYLTRPYSGFMDFASTHPNVTTGARIGLGAMEATVPISSPMAQASILITSPTETFMSSSGPASTGRLASTTFNPVSNMLGPASANPLIGLGLSTMRVPSFSTTGTISSPITSQYSRPSTISTVAVAPNINIATPTYMPTTVPAPTVAPTEITKPTVAPTEITTPTTTPTYSEVTNFTETTVPATITNPIETTIPSFIPTVTQPIVTGIGSGTNLTPPVTPYPWPLISPGGGSGSLPGGSSYGGGINRLLRGKKWSFPGLEITIQSPLTGRRSVSRISRARQTSYGATAARGMRL